MSSLEMTMAEAGALAIRGWLEQGFTPREKRLLAHAVLSIGILADNVEPAFALAAKLGITDLVAAESERFCELAVMPALERDARLVAALHAAKAHPDYGYVVMPIDADMEIGGYEPNPEAATAPGDRCWRRKVTMPP